MWLMLNPNIELQLIIAVLITLNSFVRLMFPSQYNPSLSSKNHILYHPFMARTLATLAEFSMYWLWARWVNQPYWGALLGITVTAGELVCWLTILFQSRTLGFLEDTIWVIHASEMLYFSDTIAQMVVYGVFVAYVICVQLPRDFEMINPVTDCKLYRGTKVRKPDRGNLW